MAAFELITNTEVDSSGITNIAFASLGSYDHLYLVGSLRTDTSDSAGWDDVYWTFNGSGADRFILAGQNALKTIVHAVVIPVRGIRNPRTYTPIRGRTGFSIFTNQRWQIWNGDCGLFGDFNLI